LGVAGYDVTNVGLTDKSSVRIERMLQSIRSVLAIPAAYNLWWNVVGGPGWAKVLVSEYVQPKVGARILEIGCGPGTIARYLPRVEYVGFDVSSKYIEMARKRFPQAQFVCERVSQFSLAKQHSFDVVLALGILHHLDDQEAGQLFKIAHDALKSGGKLVTFDGVFTNDQSAAARWLLARDRGEYVRNEKGYVKIASQVFANVRTTIHHDLLRVPYTHLILECVRR
jgi:cyclopropane fatty-acyl-phospholipid synthase-like methyltransferase